MNFSGLNSDEGGSLDLEMFAQDVEIDIADFGFRSTSDCSIGNDDVNG